MRVFISFLTISALIVAGLFVSSATAEQSNTVTSDNAETAIPVAAGADAKKHYKKCQGCHAKDGSGKTKMGQKYKAPDFRDPDWQKRHSLEKIKTAIRKGVPNTKMPAFTEKRLNDEALDAVAKYIKSMGR